MAGMEQLKRFLAPAFSWRTARDGFYLILGLVYGVLWGSLIITLYSVGLGLVVIWIGVLILLLTQVLLRGIGSHERMLARGFLGEDIPEPEPREQIDPAERRGTLGFLAWAGTVWRDRHAWRVASWVIFRFIVGPIGFSLAITYFVLPPAILLDPFVPSAWIPDDVHLGHGVEWFYLGPLMGIVLFPFVAWAVKGLADAHRTIARWALGPVNG
jgi:hypothetical protein